MNKEDIIDLNSLLIYIESISDKSSLIDWLNLEEESAVIQVHHSLGRTLRNDFKLWSDGKMISWFNNLGIYHPDDMSSIILTSLYRKLNDIDLDLDLQIKNYVDFWEENNANVNKGILN